MYLFRLLTLMMTLVLLSKCSESNKADPQPDACKDIFCTQEFRTITVSVENESGEPVQLDSYTVTDLKANEQLSIDQSLNTEGNYVIYSDKYVKEHQNTERTLVFEGMLSGSVVVTEEYRVAADCCHVTLVEGSRTLVVQP